MSIEKPDASTGEAAVVEELVLSPREAGQTTESAFKHSIDASIIKPLPPKHKFRATPRRPKKNRKKKR